MDNFRYFRYRAINKNLIDSIVSGYLFFAPPEKLNDPYDCQIDLKKALTYAAFKTRGSKQEVLQKIANLQDFTDEIQSRMKNVGLCSFSLDLHNALLWSHYGEEHKGLCLLFEFTPEYLLDRENEIVGVSDVHYGENAVSDWLIENIPDQIKDDFYDRFTTELLKIVLIAKSKDWHYENECRIIRENPGPFYYPKECLKQVCFGMRTPEKDIQLVRKLVENSGYSVSFCRMKKNETDFGFSAIEI